MAGITAPLGTGGMSHLEPATSVSDFTEAGQRGFPPQLLVQYSPMKNHGAVDFSRSKVP